MTQKTASLVDSREQALGTGSGRVLFCDECVCMQSTCTSDLEETGRQVIKGSYGCDFKSCLSPADQMWLDLCLQVLWLGAGGTGSVPFRN